MTTFQQVDEKREKLQKIVALVMDKNIRWSTEYQFSAINGVVNTITFWGTFKYGYGNRGNVEVRANFETKKMVITPNIKEPMTITWKVG